MKWINVPFNAECGIVGKLPAERLATQQEQCVPEQADFKNWVQVE